MLLFDYLLLTCFKRGVIMLFFMSMRSWFVLFATVWCVLEYVSRVRARFPVRVSEQYEQTGISRRPLDPGLDDRGILTLH